MDKCLDQDAMRGNQLSREIEQICSISSKISYWVAGGEVAALSQPRQDEETSSFSLAGQSIADNRALAVSLQDNSGVVPSQTSLLGYTWDGTAPFRGSLDQVLPRRPRSRTSP